MSPLNSKVTVAFENTSRHCPIGETTGKTMMANKQIPVISCEGSCIRGEIARLAANMLAKEAGYGRGCHGEIISVPQSAMAGWAAQADKIVVIDGCFLHCHGRVLKGLFKESQLAIFDALSFYGKYTDVMDPDDVTESERMETAEIVLNNVLENLKLGLPVADDRKTTACSGGCGDRKPADACC